MNNQMQTQDIDVLGNAAMAAFTGVPQSEAPAPALQGVGPALSGQEAMLASGMALQKTQTPYTTAVQVQKPRDLDAVVRSVLQEATYAGESFYYAWDLKGKNGGRVEGASIGLAYSLARAWGNCVVDLEHKTENGVDVFTARFVDLETGYTTTRIFRQKSNPIGGKYDAARKEDMHFQVGQSKALRNVILAAVPRWLVEEAVRRAKEAVVHGIQKIGVYEARAKVVKFFAGYGVEAHHIEAYLKKIQSEWNENDIATLRGIAKTIQDGQAGPEEYFDMTVDAPGEKKPAESEQEAPAKEIPAEAKPEPAPGVEEAAAELTDKEKKTIANALAAEKAFPEEAVVARKALGLTNTKNLTPDQAIKLNRKISQILDEEDA